jgi:hypothetical protein
METNGELKQVFKRLRRLKCEGGVTAVAQIEEEKEEEMPFTGQNKAHSRHILFSSTGMSVSD